MLLLISWCFFVFSGLSLGFMLPWNCLNDFCCWPQRFPWCVPLVESVYPKRHCHPRPAKHWKIRIEFLLCREKNSFMVWYRYRQKFRYLAFLISKHSCTNFLFVEQTCKCSYFFIVQSFAFILPDIRPGGNPNLGAKNSVTLSHSWSNNKFLNNVLKIEVLKGFLRLFIW
jgi:hypothetical protein